MIKTFYNLQFVLIETKYTAVITNMNGVYGLFDKLSLSRNFFLGLKLLKLILI